MSHSFDFERPEHFAVGSVGPPGQRAFYLQAREAGGLVTLKLEKEHVGALGDYLARLLAKLPAGAGGVLAGGALIEPLDAAWIVGSIAVGYEEALDRIVVVATELVEEEGGETAATARFLITRVQAAAFVQQAAALIKAGRPICPLCSRPKDPGGHVCPRSNGHNVARS